MPTYEYACRACGEHLEVVQSFRDTALTTCGLCGGDLRKVFSAAGIIFRGSGYYVNDSRKAAADAVSASKRDGKGDTKTEVSSDAKSGSAGSESASPDTKAKPDTAKPDTAKPAETKPAARTA